MAIPAARVHCLLCGVAATMGSRQEFTHTVSAPAVRGLCSQLLVPSQTDPQPPAPLLCSPGCG